MASLKNTTINDTGHLTIPSGTILQRPATPSAGMFRYNSDYKLNEFYNGTEWTTSTGENSIVQNGLVLWLDAGLSSSYPGSGTTWTNLRGNGNNGTLTNGPTYSSANGGSIVFDGSNDYVDCGSVSAIGSSLTGLTVSVWVNPSVKETKCIAENGTNYDTNTFYMFQENADYFTFEVYGTFYDAVYSNFVYQTNTWYYLTGVWSSNSRVEIYCNGVLSSGTRIGSAQSSLINGNTNLLLGSRNYGSFPFNGRYAHASFYNRALSSAEIRQNYLALKNRFGVIVDYETLTYTTSANLAVTGNGTNSVNIFKTSGSNAWDNHAYTTTAFTAPCTIEFNKDAGTSDAGTAYAMIGWNEDPTTNASYTSLDYASYPYATTNGYEVYHNGSYLGNFGSWNKSLKLYVVYGTDGFIRHYNGSTLLYSVNYGTGKTVYVDSSFYSVNATFGGFSNIRVCRSAWNGTQYV